MSSFANKRKSNVIDLEEDDYNERTNFNKRRVKKEKKEKKQRLNVEDAKIKEHSLYNHEVKMLKEWREVFKSEDKQLRIPEPCDYQFFGPFHDYCGHDHALNQHGFIVSGNEQRPTFQSISCAAFPSFADCMMRPIDNEYYPVFVGDITGKDARFTVNKQVPQEELLFSRGVLERYSDWKINKRGEYETDGTYFPFGYLEDADKKVYLHTYYEKFRNAELAEFGKSKGVPDNDFWFSTEYDTINNEIN